MGASKGLLHFHSRYSFDAALPLSKIAAMAKAEGFQFVCVTEHTNELTEADFKKMAEECGRLSDECFCLIPGLEFTCDDGTHLLAFGLETWIKTRALPEIVSSVGLNAVLVAAHPSKRVLSILFDSPEIQKKLCGLEIWNRKYHGILSPSPACLKALARIRNANEMFFGFGGVDFHEKEDRFSPEVELTHVSCSRHEILGALRSGQFKINGAFFSVKADGRMNLFSSICLLFVHRIRTGLFLALKGMKYAMGWTKDSEFRLKFEKKLKRYL